MADGKKISELTKLSNLADADEFVVVNKDVTSGDESGIGGQTSRITFSDLKSEIGTQGPQGPAGGDGAAGKSAYDLWIEAGNTGSIAQFLESLKGPAGSDGAVGPAGPTGPKGETGDSAFTVTSSGQLSLGNNKVGIGIDSAEATLHIKDSRPTLRLTDGASPGVADFEIANDDDILFIRSIPGENLLTITPNGFVGMGTNEPTGNKVAGKVLDITSSDASILRLNKSGGTDYSIYTGENSLVFHDNNENVHSMCLTGNKLGVGTHTPTAMIHVKSTTSSAQIKVEATKNSGSDEAWLHLQTPTSNYGLFANDLTDQFGIRNHKTDKYPLMVNVGTNNVTFEGVVSAKGFSVNGKDLYEC